MNNALYKLSKNCICLLLFSCLSGWAAAESEKLTWLENGHLKLGANLSLGGAITWLGPAGTETNLVNNHDWGRQVQMSFYSGPTPFAPNGKQPKPHWAGLGWNPIQSGDCFGNRAEVLSHETVNGELHIVCRPMQWPLDNEPGECTFESWISLDGNRVRVRGRLNNARSDTTWYGGGGQELPAVYTNGEYYRLMTYIGEQPFAGGALERITKKTEPGFPWKFWTATERWAALVNDADWGLGVIMPGTTHFVGGFAGEEGAGGTKDAPTGYIAPLRTEVLDHNITYDFSYVLVLGSLEEIRTAALAEAKPAAPPAWDFQQHRQGWYYKDARDAGWPIAEGLDLSVLGEHPAMLSPVTFWRAEESPTLEVTLRNPGEQRSVRVCWRRHGDADFNDEYSSTLDVTASKKPETYRVSLAGGAGYSGGMVQLKLSLVGAAGTIGSPLFTLEKIRLLGP